MLPLTALLLLPLLLLLHAPQLHAHSLGESYGVLRLDTTERRISVTYNMRRDQFLQLAEPQVFALRTPLEVLATTVRNRYQLRTAGAACTQSRFAVRESEAFLQASFVAVCPEPGPLSLHNDAFFDLLPDHLHFVRVSTTDGRLIAEQVQDRSMRDWVIPEVPSTALTPLAQRYLRLGMDHMLFGFDHLAFLASVLLLAQGLKPLLLAITGFTLGHSVTLALTVLGFAVPSSALVEALIGLTIALVAAESVFLRQARLTTYALLVFGAGVLLATYSALRGWPDPIAMVGISLFFSAYLLLAERRPGWRPTLLPLLTAFFGLIHGFGFAGSLLDIGLPGEHLAVALAVFNLGIEISQVLIVAAVLALLAAMQRLVPRSVALSSAGHTALASALVALGMYWFAQRAFA
ncbi:MAG: HupE/UreJ family protein [Lamprobacter sp.]|uniref:HupE/UreJ family protein n=1 Tax=Lamprobacter sp. TaxID=3100796 RepID=UPI002B260781|nr:HupE/UreJ family protein [Lamprobacter sp.]MEA3643344.1 HupE/UreJ family protein [Lamprobacter sp.]